MEKSKYLLYSLFLVVFTLVLAILIPNTCFAQDKTREPGFEPYHNLELSFNLENIEVKKGESKATKLILKNCGNVPEVVSLEVKGELKEYVNMDQTVNVEAGGETSIFVKIVAESALELKTYSLIVQAHYSNMETTAKLNVIVVSGPITQKESGESAEASSTFFTGTGAVCMICLIFLAVMLIINIALLVWIYRDSKNRGMGNSGLWVLLVLLAGLVAYIVYFVVRPKGNLITCRHCEKKMLEHLDKCPHCKY